MVGIRLPRVLLGLEIGAALAVSGALMQGLFRNPLADPGLIGVSSGEWGALRPVEHAQMVFQYRHAPLYGRRIFFKSTRDILDAEGRPKDAALQQRFDDFLKGFLQFCRQNR